MNILFTVLFLSSSLLASMGDCFTCHPKLIKGIDTDENHHAMLSCIKCHAPNKKSVPECGSKCFSCHSEEDLRDADVSEHDIIQECRNCHVVDTHKLFDISNSFDQTLDESMKDFLLK